MQISPRLFIISPLLKPNMLEGWFKEEMLGIFHTVELRPFELWGIYKYQIIFKKNVLQKYLGTEYSITLQQCLL